MLASYADRTPLSLPRRLAIPKKLRSESWKPRHQCARILGTRRTVFDGLHLGRVEVRRDLPLRNRARLSAV